ncbi:efflux RND transporter periplasmic adaptor subunit [Caulobacter segnis]|uniref:efflux RND transporter periplasmic adaptor subunit n=1 Tax=Caulobacter segnis TaxID=88688 RepID=UPI00241088DF|nr:efflux RND transporter periplasmic adaptor subunit [Caulobacter segnis]MDG2522868.1 efflux RND transporter periplasmic adaptor subunit [Caulobacter segnis]
MRKILAVAAIGATGIVLTACGPKAAQPQGGPPQVSVATPLQERVVDWNDFVGRFEAPQSVQVRARAGGYIQAIHFRDGQQVKAGQLLFTLDPRPAQAAVASAKAQADQARNDLKRAESLLAATAISREEFETRRAAAQVADAALRARELDLEFTRVTAPVSGTISDRRVDAGNVISGGTSNADVLTTIVSTNPIHFVFESSEAQLLTQQRQSGRAGGQVKVRLQDEAEYRWNGTVDFSDNAVDASSGSFRMRAVVNNPNGFLKPGMFGRARVEGSGAYNAMLIPQEAVVADGARKVAYVVAGDGAVTVKPIQLGPLSGGLRVVKTGLRPDDRVIVNGIQRAQPGQKVTAVNSTISRKAGGEAPPQLAAPTPAATATPVQ